MVLLCSSRICTTSRNEEIAEYCVGTDADGFEISTVKIVFQNTVVQTMSLRRQMGYSGKYYVSRLAMGAEGMTQWLIALALFQRTGVQTLASPTFVL